MINLLPPEEKELLRLDANKKITIILGMSLLIPAVALALILASVDFYILGEIHSNSQVLKQAELQYQTQSFLSFKTIIQKNNASLAALDSFYKKDSPASNTLQIVSSLTRPQGLYWTSLALQKQDGQAAKITASGFAKSRDDLLAFQKTMQKDNHISNISFAPESWIDAKNVTFFVTFEMPT